eukprot:CAMPEP_0113613636 /NCGR_PEP_ID=MMETSP0017_2-20120614/6743_1 /TAXON_ID=2856 /ORGANISM="Cylindrotheca closterium" /LENGTH=333 /DNA_ID=CAMNT_0000522759 /DNA_START=828 /DNA_END=1829 /DNA_ORIENTATION=- /assembly_acc=CAM_ASM_000147
MSNTNQLILSLLLLLVLSHVNGFSIGPSSQRVPASSTTTTVLQEGKDENTDPDMNPLTKSAWYATELFGKVFGNKDKVQSENDAPPEELDFSQPPQSLKETLARIKLDNDRSYFLSGQVDEEIYDPKCVFSDPFVAFEGRERFVTNLANLGSFITNYSARVLNYDEQDPTVVQTKIMVKLELNLPWKPILAWPWGVQYTIDPETNLIVDHKESWDIEALEGVKQIFLCVFSDPFVAFEGRERFVTNLANLGSFITNYSAKVLNYDEQDPTVVQTKIMVKLELNLPWKPILAWPWGVQYTIDPETNLIVDHKESWDIEALEGVKQIFRKPTLTI